MKAMCNSFRRPRLIFKRLFSDLMREGREPGSDKFSLPLFFRKTVRKHFSLLLYFLICLVAFICFCGEYSFGANLLFIVFCVGCWTCTAPWERRIAASSLVLLTILDNHFNLHYRKVFHEIGNQALVALQITDRDEVISYLRGLFTSEVILYAVLLAALASLFFVRMPERICRSRYARIIPLAIFIFGISYNIILPYKGFVTEWREKGALLQKRANFSFHAEDKRPGIPQHIFFVIGETHRHDHMDLLTTERFAPVLHRLKSEGNLLTLDDIITCYQTTYFSVSSLLTRRETDDQKRFFSEKGLIDLYKEAGYHTIFITYYQASLENDIYNITLRAADEHINYRNYGNSRLDRLMLPVCRKISRDHADEKLLVVIKMIGAHFYYQDRHTCETMLYLPAFAPQSDVKNYDISMKEKIRNSYKNAVLESSVCLNGIAEIVSSSQTPAMMFFISDHGATNYDDGKNPFIGDAPENFHIPCFFYFNDGFMKLLPESEYANLKHNADAPVTNSYIFDTVVSLSGIHYPSRRPAMDLTSPSFIAPKERHVWLWNSRVPYDTLGK